MSNDRKYTMYRQDARGTIEVDLNDPIYSLDQLIEKQGILVEAAKSKLNDHRNGVELYTARFESEIEAYNRLVLARDAANAALGENNE